MAYIHVVVDDDLHRRFKAACAERGVTIAEIIRGIVQLTVTEYDREHTARQQRAEEE